MKKTNEKNYVQLCVRKNVTMGQHSPEQFEEWFRKMGVRVKFAEEVVTLPERDESGEVIKNSEQHDVLFYIHTDDIVNFAVLKLQFDICWWEDLVKRGPRRYPKEILERYPITW